MPDHDSGYLSLGEVIASDPMRGIAWHALADLERPVHQVRLVDDVEQVRSCRPGTIVVLQPGLARTAWSTAIAVRYAWERDVRAVICQLDATALASVTALAGKLSVPVGVRPDGDLPSLALALSALVGQPEATRARFIARCAERITAAHDVQEVCDTLAAELPGVHIQLQTVPLRQGPARPVETAGAANPEASRERVRLPLTGVDRWRRRDLVASWGQELGAWEDAMTTILRIARAQLMACQADDLLPQVRRRRRDEWELRRIVSGAAGSPTFDDGFWPVPDHVVAVLVLPGHETTVVDDLLDLAFAESWRGPEPPIKLGHGWAVWREVRRPEDSAAAFRAESRRTVDALLTDLNAWLRTRPLDLPLVAGIGGAQSGPDRLATSLLQAGVAARAARHSDERVLVFDRLGPAAFLATADNRELRLLATSALGALTDLPDSDTLLATVAAYLDAGGSTVETAARLGVHRNTVTGRLDRVRRLGIDLHDPHTRLGLHMAAHLLAR